MDIFLKSETSVDIAEAMGRGLTGYAKAFDRLSPDIVVILGDRFEALAAVVDHCIANRKLVFHEA